MKLNKRWLIVYIIALLTLTFVQGAYGGIQLTASGSASGESGSVSMNYDILKSTSLSSKIAINGGTITPSTAISGSLPLFEETHAVTDHSGKSASVYVKVVNAPDGLTYSSKVLPGEGNVDTQSQISAEQWLTVPTADSIKVTAASSYGKMAASVGLEEYKGTASKDYVTLTEYNGKAVTTETMVAASQTATNGAANLIKVYGSSKDRSGSYNIDTAINGIAGRATIEKMSETASGGIDSLVLQDEHVHGTFTSIATYKSTTGAKKTKTRTSAYGTEYDIDMNALKVQMPLGYLGYYIKPGMKIQGAVNVAYGGDTINVAAGTYRENLKIFNSLTLKGAGAGETIIDGGGIGTVITTGKSCVDNRYKNIYLKGLTIRNGYAPSGGGIANVGCNLVITDVLLTGNTATAYGGAICSTGTVTMNSGSITENKANLGGGIANLGTLNLKGGNIAGNTAKSYGGGIYSSNSRVTLDGIQVIVKSNKAGKPLSESSWYKGWGVYLNSGKPTITGSFDPATQVIGNSHI